MLSYPIRAKIAIVRLFKPYNDIDVYVEDTTCRAMYEVLLSRMLQGKAKLRRVFQAGGRNKVLDEAKKYTNDKSRSRIFIIDGDIDLLTGNRLSLKENIYCLEVYCSENLLLSKSAFVEVAYESDTNKSRNECERAVEYDALINEIETDILPLFKVYAIAEIFKTELNEWQQKQISSVDLRTVIIKVEKYCIKAKNVEIKLSNDKLNNKMNELSKYIISAVGKQKYDETMIAIDKVIKKYRNDNVHLISGKTYVLPLFWHRMKMRLAYKGTSNQFRVALARSCDMHIDKNLIKALHRQIRIG